MKLQIIFYIISLNEIYTFHLNYRTFLTCFASPLLVNGRLDCVAAAAAPLMQNASGAFHPVVLDPSAIAANPAAVQLQQASPQMQNKVPSSAKNSFTFYVTSRERPKSAPYLRLKNSKRTSKCQSILFYGTGKTQKLNRIGAPEGTL